MKNGYYRNRRNEHLLIMNIINITIIINIIKLLLIINDIKSTFNINILIINIIG